MSLKLDIIILHMGSLVPGRILPLRSIFQKFRAWNIKTDIKADDLRQLITATTLPILLGFPGSLLKGIKKWGPGALGVSQRIQRTARWRSRRWSLLLLRRLSLQRCQQIEITAYPPFLLTLRFVKGGEKWFQGIVVELYLNMFVVNMYN